MTATTTAQPTIALSQLAPHPHNPRRDVGRIDDLAASAKEVGILEPLVIAPPFEGATGRAAKAGYLVLCGNRRLAAAKKARLKEVPVVIRDDITTLGAQIDVMLVENLHRVDLSPVEEGDAYQQVLDLDGLTQKDLAARIGQPRRRISERLRIAKSVEAVRDAVHHHQVSITDALAIAELDDEPGLQGDVIASIGTDNFAWTLNRARKTRERMREIAKTIAALVDAGVLVHTDGAPEGSTLLYNLRFGDDWGQSRNPEWEQAHHADCPGRIAYIADDTVLFACSEPQLHRSSPSSTSAPSTSASLDGEPTAEETAEAERRVAEREKREADLAAAQQTRDDFVSELICKGGRPPEGIVLTDDVVRARLVALILQALGYRSTDRWANETEVRSLLIALGRSTDVVEALDEDDLDAAVADALAGRNVHNLVLILDVATQAEAAGYVQRVATGAWGRDWLEALRDYGYKFSDFERQTYTWRADEDDDDPLVERWWTVDGIVGKPVETEGAA